MKFRIAKIEDLEQIMNLLNSDVLGHFEKVDYTQVFKEIEADSNNEIIVGEMEGEVLGCLQITYIPTLSLGGTKRANIEGVRVSSKLRSKGHGQKLIEFAINRAKLRQCKLIQLTTNKTRVDAIRFYEKIGFKRSHEGMKLECI